MRAFAVTPVLAVVCLALSPARADAALLCTITASNFTFPNYDPTAGAATTGSTSVTVACAPAGNVVVSLSAGNSASTATPFAPRTMILSGGTTALTYNLFQDTGYATVFGDGVAGDGSQTKTVFANLIIVSGTNVPIYGKITPSQNATAGTYIDSITATINF